MHGAVTEQPGEGGTIERRPIDDLAAPARFEVLQLDDHVDVRAVTAAGVGLLVVEEEPTDVDQGIRPPGGGGMPAGRSCRGWPTAGRWPRWNHLQHRTSR